jgi:hypothetical protein
MSTSTRIIRVRQSLDLPVAQVSERDAELELEALVDELKAKATGKVWRGHPVAVAALAYLEQPRERPLRPSTIRIVQEIVARFGRRLLNKIATGEWNARIDGDPATGAPGRMAGPDRSAQRADRTVATALIDWAGSRP